ncbi:hypothetical protein ABZ814_01645 [Micromonospora musae]|uniref:hypothetical protein n=1 Tax=Micromonospora musae TaxID=1894970 RepID=UPI0033C857C0
MAGVVVLLAAAGLVVPAVPAYAEEPVVDVGVAVVGTRLAANRTDKIAVVKVSNHGTVTPDLLALDYDAGDVDSGKVRIDPLLDECDVDGDEQDDRWSCPLRGEQIPGPGETVELPLLVIKTTDQLTEAYRATLAVSVTPWSDGKPLADADPANNADEHVIELATVSGADLTVVAPDITREIDLEDAFDDDPESAPLNPGDRTVASAYVVNQGDWFAVTLSLRMTLPAGLTFEQRDGDCGTSPDLRTMTCLIEPVGLTTREGVQIAFPVRVAAELDAPATYPGGSVTVSGTNLIDPPDEDSARRDVALPPYLRKVSGAPPITDDVDPSDNTDEFAAVVTAAAGGGPGEGGGGGDVGGLPVTGPQARLIGGIGVSVLFAGVVLILVARRRRVVLVAPQDEQPAA